MTLRDELQAVLEAYLDAYRAGDAAGCAAVYAPDALLTSPWSSPARGRAAIEAVHRDWTEDGSAGKQLVMVDCGGSGSLAWFLARFAEGASTGTGVSLNLLERRPDGRWHIRMSSLNEGDLPPG